MLTTAPQAIIEPLQQFYTQDVPDKMALMRFCKQLNEFAENSKTGEPHLQEMQQLIQDMSTETAFVRESVKASDTAWETQIHYERKVESVEEQITRSPRSNTKLTEKLARNVQKKRESQQAFQMAINETHKAVNGVMAAKWRKTGKVLSTFCHYYSVVFKAADQMAQACTDIADQLAASLRNEAMVSKDHDCVAQAQNPFSNFTSIPCKNIEDTSKTVIGGWGSSFNNVGTVWPATKIRSASADSAENRSASVDGAFGGWSTPQVPHLSRTGSVRPQVSPPTPSPLSGGASVMGGMDSRWFDYGTGSNNSSRNNCWEPWAPKENRGAFMRPQYGDSTPKGTNPWAHLNHNSLKQSGPELYKPGMNQATALQRGQIFGRI